LFIKMLYNKLMINYDDFSRLDIRIGTILEAEPVPETTKLLKLKVDLGSSSTSGQDIRTLVAGIAETYTPEKIIGKQIPILTNLEPRTIKGVESNGMILAIDIENKAILLKPLKKVPNGSKIR
jgi:methionyl-tRNA synthetase